MWPRLGAVRGGVVGGGAVRGGVVDGGAVRGRVVVCLPGSHPNTVIQVSSRVSSEERASPWVKNGSTWAGDFSCWATLVPPSRLEPGVGAVVSKDGPHTHTITKHS